MVRAEYGVDALPQPSKALFSGDRSGYDEAFQAFRKQCRHESLGEAWFQEQLGDEHWFQRNVDHFIPLVDLMDAGRWRRLSGRLRLRLSNYNNRAEDAPTH